MTLWNVGSRGSRGYRCLAKLETLWNIWLQAAPVLSRQPIEMSYRWGLARQVACFLRHYRSRRGITTGSRWSQFSRQSRFRMIIMLDSPLSPILSVSCPFPPSEFKLSLTGNWKRGEQIPVPFREPIEISHCLLGSRNMTRLKVGRY